MQGAARQVKEAKAGGNTKLYDAIVFACDKLRARSEEQVTGKVVIVISDGDDTAKSQLNVRRANRSYPQRSCYVCPEY